MLTEFLTSPLRGTTSLWRLTWLYGLVAGSMLDVVGGMIAGPSDAAQRLMLLVGLAYASYLTIATYRCAANSRWPALAPMIRAAAAISLLLAPFIAYVVLTLDLTGATIKGWIAP